MSTSDRVKYQAAIYGGIVGAVLVVLGVAAIVTGGYLYMNPPTPEEPTAPDGPEPVTETIEFRTSIQHSAEVVEPTPLYEDPAAVSPIENQPVYFRNGTPDLQLEAVAELPADQSVNVTSHNLTVYREVTFEGTTFWDEERVLASDSGTVEDGQLSVGHELDIAAVSARDSEIANAVSGAGSVSSGIRLRTEYNSEAGDGTLTVESDLQITGQAYWLTNNELEDVATEEVVVSAPEEGGDQAAPEPDPNLTVVGGLALLGIVLIGGGIGLARWSSRDADVRELEEKVHRSRYDEWISEGDFPTDAGKQYVYINALEGLVDIAIDTGKRVIYDPELETYGVVDDDLVYYHASDPTTIDSWVNFTREES
jgi:hypothetical protein